MTTTPTRRLRDLRSGLLVAAATLAGCGGNTNPVAPPAPPSATSSAGTINASPATGLAVATAFNFVAANFSTTIGSLSYAWAFGDGATGSGSPATHAYSGPGTFTVRVTATSSGGGSPVSATTTVNVKVVTGSFGLHMPLPVPCNPCGAPVVPDNRGITLTQVASSVNGDITDRFGCLIPVVGSLASRPGAIGVTTLSLQFQVAASNSCQGIYPVPLPFTFTGDADGTGTTFSGQVTTGGGAVPATISPCANGSVVNCS